MKGTPEEPQCGFSRAVIQILGIHGVPADKMKAYNVLEDAELRSGIKEFSWVFLLICSVSIAFNKLMPGCARSREWPTIPQVYVGGEFVGGCDIVISSKFLCHLLHIKTKLITRLSQCTSLANWRNYWKSMKLFPRWRTIPNRLRKHRHLHRFCIYLYCNYVHLFNVSIFLVGLACALQVSVGIKVRRRVGSNLPPTLCATKMVLESRLSVRAPPT